MAAKREQKFCPHYEIADIKRSRKARQKEMGGGSRERRTSRRNIQTSDLMPTWTLLGV